MPLPTPGTPFTDIVNRSNNIVRTGGRFGGRRGFLPTAPINSSLQTLSPADLAILGLGGIASIPNVGGPYSGSALQPGEQIGEIPGAPNGTYGEEGVEYRIINCSSTGSCPNPGSSQYSNFGPITPVISVSPNGQVFYWDFQGFDSNGDPRTVPGTVPTAGNRWNQGQPQLTFEISVFSDPSQTPIPMTPGSDEPTPILLPDTTDLPGVNSPTELQEEFDESEDRQIAIADLIQDVTENVQEIDDFLKDKLACDICGILSNESLEQGLFRNRVDDALDEIQRIIDFELDVTVDESDCELMSNPVTYMGDTLQSWADLIGGITAIQQTIKEASCEASKRDCAVPEEWTLRKNPATPTTVLRMRESSVGHSGTPKPRDINIPLYNGDGLTGFPTWTRGDYRCTVSDDNGLRITVWASSQAQARSVCDTLADMSDGFSTRRYVDGFQENIVVNKVALTPFKTLRFSNGRFSGTEPDRICNIEKGLCFP